MSEPWSDIRQAFGLHRNPPLGELPEYAKNYDPIGKRAARLGREVTALSRKRRSRKKAARSQQRRTLAKRK